ncbi:SDR family oxidoreductase [Actinosynnema pretiosum subsp. pretiosum]|uniref:Short-chain dehydrogenase/reductase SDR n=2 Tax=Actinosynnema TaxID=40566 RepID=C6WFR5_ACTMD|nr:short-chain dehydrogenase/reductase SDR [Actinosynnema mirum DSM 43827]AXX31333.1 3-oxoacyl-[acyl-carrier protein] reductase [Actinosynnema pretiosum subsp. pretiosum]QUF04607.1 SDR family oxidoreductase [Actinosynnema pretiosum subsp. pretiosum]
MSDQHDHATHERHPKPEDQHGQSQRHPGSGEDMDPKPDHGESTYRGSGKLDGRRAVITGGDSGIGRAVALAFAAEGADVLLSYLPEEQEDAERTAELVRERGRKAVLVAGDITDERHCGEIVDRALGELGGIDVLVNNAAHQMAQEDGLLGISSEQFDRVLKTNLYAMFWLCKAAVPHLEPGATIINTSSIQAVDPSPQLLDYATTKAGIVNFTKGLAIDLAERGIRVNTVAPGPVWTPLIPATMPEDAVANFGEQVPLGRAAQPVELAPAYVFLASAESSYITGAVIPVTGGKPFN